MDYERDEILSALKYLKERYPDAKVNNNIVIATNDLTPIVVTKEYKFESMKQSVFKNVRYQNCHFENVALTGSTFDFVSFSETSLIGNSFANCNFYMVEIDGLNKILEANNFSQSNFENCTLNNVEMFKSGVLNALFHNCKLSNAYFHGSTFEGTKFINCAFENCDFGNVNLDYTVFSKNQYTNVCFPFYQIAYIIGAADFFNDANQEIYAQVGNNKIPVAEVRGLIDKLILFYLDKNEYFPVCNLYIAKNDNNSAREYLLDGITKSLSTHDFRMINNFCQLAKHHDIVNDKVRYKIIKAMDDFIQSENVPEAQLNYYLIYIGKIKTLLNDGAGNTVTLNYSIKTNTCKKNDKGVQFVNDFVNDLNSHISQLEDVEGFQISVSNHSPFEIAVAVVTLVGSIGTIATSIMSIISSAKEKGKKKELIEIPPEESNRYLDSRIEQMKYQLLYLQKECAGRELNEYIEEVTQSLKTDLEEAYTKDVMIFKLKNKPDKKKK